MRGDMSQVRGLADNSLVGEGVTRRCDMSQVRGLADNSYLYKYVPLFSSEWGTWVFFSCACEQI